MAAEVPDYTDRFAAAIAEHWDIKEAQQVRASSGKAVRSPQSGAVLAGKHMEPFERLVVEVVTDAGLQIDDMPERKIYLPGFYRETKSWDVVLQCKGHLVAVVEAKSQGSSLANNFNNRVEEAIGQAADIWKADERNLIGSGFRPWVGYLMVVAETPKTVESKRLKSGKFVPPGMTVDPRFDGMSFAERYATAFQRLDQERMLDATCVAITRDRDSFPYPNEWLSFNGFAAQLWGRCRHMQAVLG